MSRPTKRATSSTAVATKLSAATGVVAAMVLAVLANVAVSRHFRRWDLTSHGLYTLSPATVQTLHGLESRVSFDVLLPNADPLASTVRFLLDAYGAETDRLEVRYVDPDRHAAEFLAVQQRFGVEAGRTEDGQIVTDAAIVVSRVGGKPFFLTPGQLVDSGDGAEERARSKVEQAFTTAIRTVLDDERPAICFSTGHREKRLDDTGAAGLADLASRLRKNNYDAVPIDASRPDADKALAACRMLAIVGPTEPFGADEAARLRAWLVAGGNLLVMANPVPDPDRKALLPLGLDAVTSAGGVALDEDFVFELDGKRRLPGGFGEQYFAEPRPHDVTLALLGERNQDLKILFAASRSIGKTSAGSVVPTELLVTSERAFGMRDFFAWAEKSSGAPERGPDDRKGPLAVAMAAELPKPAGSTLPHGPRLVVVGSATPALGQSFSRDLRGGAVFVESAISWLVARPQLVDVPDKPAAAGVRIAEASIGEVARYVMLYMPGAAALLGLAVWLRRRATDERRPGAGTPGGLG